MAASDMEALSMALASRISRRTSDLRETFLRYDKYGTGTLTAAELTHAINRSWGIKLSHQQVRAMMLSFQYKQGTLDVDYELKPAEFEYEEFVDFVDELMYFSGQTEASRIGRITDMSLLQDENVGLIDVPPGTEKKDILACIGRKLRTRTSRGLPTHELFLSFDTSRTGRVSKEEFANWFRKNGLVMTEEQCGVIMADFDAAGDGRLDYGEFTKFIGSFSAGGAPGGGRAAWEMPSRDDREAFGAAKRRAREERLLARQMAVEAQHAVNDALSALATDALTDAKLLSSIAERLQDRKWKLMAAFRKFDASGSGRVSAEEFAAGCKELGLAVSSERLASLIAKFDVKKDGQLRYFEFVRLVSSSNSSGANGGAPGEAQAVGGAAANIAPVLSQASAASAMPKTPPLERPAAAAAAAMAAGDGDGGGGGGGWAPDSADVFVDESAAEGEAIAGALTAEDVAAIQEFRSVLEEDRLKMTKVFKAFDATGDKTIGLDELRGGLASLGVDVTDDEAARILKRFDITGNGKIKYFEFVRMVSDALEIA